MFDRSGESGPPCGAPSTTATRVPSGITTAAFSIPGRGSVGRSPAGSCDPAGADDEPGRKISPDPHPPPSENPLPDTRSLQQTPCGHLGLAGIRDCWGGGWVRRSAPGPGAWPAVPPWSPRSECQVRARHPRAWEAKPAGCRPGESVPPANHGAARPADAELALRPPQPSGRQPLVPPCCVRRSAAPARDLPRTPLPPAADRDRPPGWQDLPWFCASLCAAATGDARIRPSFPRGRPLAGCRRTRSPIDGVPSFSTHLSLCSAGFHRRHCSYEEIRLLHGHRPVVVASFRSTARADPCRPPWVRTLDVPPRPPHYRPGLGWILGIAFVDTLTRPVRLAQ